MHSRCRRSLVRIVSLVLLSLASPPVHAQSDSSNAPPFTGQVDVSALAKASQNPIGSMGLVPFQNRFGWHTGPDDRFHYELNLQPVFPFPMSDGMLVVPQLTVPFVYQSFTLAAVRSGIGDSQLQVIMAPRAASVVSAGFGAMLVAPTATSQGTGRGKWSGGPAAAIVATPGPWVVGMVASQIWSFAGQSDRAPVSELTLQPFANYNMHGGWAITSQPIVTANFEAPSDERWLFPIGAGLAKTFSFLQPMSLSVAGYANIIRPTAASSFELRVLYSLLYPR